MALWLIYHQYGDINIYFFPLWSYDPQVAFMHERRCQGKHLHSNGVHGVTLSFGV